MSMTLIDIPGYCPICRLLLSRVGAHLVCPAGDYKVFAYAWNQVWNDFDADADSADDLLESLLALNRVETVAVPK